MKKTLILAALVGLAATPAQAEHWDVIGSKLKDGCTMGTYMAIVKDFWAVPVFADMLFQMNDRLHPYITTGEGDAQEVLDALVDDWNATLGN